MRPLFFVLVSLGFLFTSCGQSDDENETGGPVLLISSGNVFVTTALTASSGGSIAIINNDSVIHTVTSESAADAFDNTGDFDVVVPANSKGVFALPAAAVGTVFNYYCRFLTASMNPPNGTITVE